MKLCIVLTGMLAEGFLKLEGTADFLESWSEERDPLWGGEGNTWSFEGADQALREKTDKSIVLTDDEAAAADCTRAGFCTIGFERQGQRIHGAEEVLCSLDGLTSSYLMILFRRFHSLPVITAQTRRLIIRESLAEDFPAIYKMMKTEGAGVFRDRVSGNEDEEREKFEAYIHTAYRFFGFGLWTVVLTEGTKQTVIGRCGLSPVADSMSPDGRIELGYLIGEGYRGRGYAYEACRAILHAADEDLLVPELFICIEMPNQASQRLAEKLGFYRVKTMEKDGKELCFYRRIRPDYGKSEAEAEGAEGVSKRELSASPLTGEQSSLLESV